MNEATLRELAEKHHDFPCCYNTIMRLKGDLENLLNKSDQEGFKRGFEAGVKAQSLKQGLAEQNKRVESMGKDLPTPDPQQDRHIGGKKDLPPEPPEHFWEVLDYALDKLNQLEKDDRYIVGRASYPNRVIHLPTDNGKTLVDLAGGILTDVLQPTEEGKSDTLGYAWGDTLFAISFIEKGSIGFGIDFLNNNVFQCSKNIPLGEFYGMQDTYTPYHVDPQGFKQYLMKVIDTLRHHNF